MTMLDHVSLGISDIARSRAFYDAALAPLGLVRIVDFRAGKGADYGVAPGQTGVEFTITEESGTVIPSRGSHLCFRARDRGRRCIPCRRARCGRSRRWRAGPA